MTTLVSAIADTSLLTPKSAVNWRCKSRKHSISFFRGSTTGRRCGCNNAKSAGKSAARSRFRTGGEGRGAEILAIALFPLGEFRPLGLRSRSSRRHEARGKRQGPHRCARAQRGYAVNGVRWHVDPISGSTLTGRIALPTLARRLSSRPAASTGSASWHGCQRAAPHPKRLRFRRTPPDGAAALPHARASLTARRDRLRAREALRQ
jgi:hypothetical protein